MEALMICTLGIPGRPLGGCLLLAASLREFGGALADTPVRLFYPSCLGEFSGEESASLAALGVEPHPFEADPEVLKFPLGTKVQAAAAAEQSALGAAGLLAWLDADTLVLSPPEEFILPQDKSLGYRPVHHRLLGTRWGEERDRFWQLAYRHCGASDGEDFMMATHTGEKIRPYFNAGSYLVRPERGVLESWWENFRSGYQTPDFRSYYQRDQLYAIYTHQVILTGTVMAKLRREQLQPLSHRINYPLHLQGEIPQDLRVGRVDDLVTARYEDILEGQGWRDSLPFSAKLADWLSAKVDQYWGQGGGR